MGEASGSEDDPEDILAAGGSGEPAPTRTSRVEVSSDEEFEVGADVAEDVGTGLDQAEEEFVEDGTFVASKGKSGRGGEGQGKKQSETAPSWALCCRCV